MRTQEALEPPLVLTAGGALERVSQRNVDLIGFGFTAGGLPPGDATPELLHGGQELIDLGLLQQALHRAQPDAVMGGDEVEVDGAVLCRRHAHHPGRQVAAGAGDQRVHQQRRQGEVVNAVRLIGVAKVGQVLAIGHVGLGDDDGVGLRALDDQAKQSDQLVRLGQVHAGGAALLPQKRHGIEPEHPHAGIE